MTKAEGVTVREKTGKAAAETHRNIFDATLRSLGTILKAVLKEDH